MKLLQKVSSLYEVDKAVLFMGSVWMYLAVWLLVWFNSKVSGLGWRSDGIHTFMDDTLQWEINWWLIKGQPSSAGALAHCLLRRTDWKIQNGRQENPNWLAGSGKGSNPRLLAVSSHFSWISFLIWALLLWEMFATEKKKERKKEKKENNDGNRGH